jgi:hypothetical protein
MSKWRKYETVLRNSEIQLTKEENQKKNTVLSLLDRAIRIPASFIIIIIFPEYLTTYLSYESAQVMWLIKMKRQI